MQRTKKHKALGLFIEQAEVGSHFFTDKSNNHVHSLCKYYGRIATCEPIKAILGDKVINLVKITLVS